MLEIVQKTELLSSMTYTRREVMHETEADLRVVLGDSLVDTHAFVPQSAVCLILSWHVFRTYSISVLVVFLSLTKWHTA
jgi:hypothetical protein